MILSRTKYILSGQMAWALHVAEINFLAVDKIFCPRQKVFVMGNIFLSGTKLISSGTKNILSEQRAQALDSKDEWALY